MTPIASIIVPTKDRARILDGCLSSLVAQSTAGFEVLVVDNGSQDDTAAVAATYQALLPLRYIHASEPGLHVARHAGMMQASSDILVFCDDDIVAGPRWIEAIVACFEDKSVAMVGGNNHPLFASPPPRWLLELWQKPVYKGHALSYLSILDFGEGRFDIEPGYIWGCNFCIRRDDLIKAGGFHPDALPDELIRYRGDGETHVSNHVRASGRRAVFDSDASVWHRVGTERMSARYFKKRAYAQGISDSYTVIRRSGGVRTTPGDMVRRLSSRLQGWVAGDSPNGLRDIQRSIAAAYAEGYEFHQQQAKGDPDLLRWILKDHYL